MTTDLARPIMKPTQPELPVRILGTSTVLPGAAKTTAEIAALLPEKRDPAEWERKTGIKTRHWAEHGARVAPFAAEALRQALDAAGLPAAALRRIIVVHSGIADVSFPALGNKVAAALGLTGSCDTFDVNNACMGFLSGFDIAARSQVTGLGPVAVVSAEMTSRGLHLDDHRPYLVFGDAFSAVIVGAARPGEGVIASAYGNDGSHPDDVFADHPSLTGKREFIQFRKTSSEIFQIAYRAMKIGVTTVLDRAGVSISDVEWVLPHQPNGAMLGLMIEAFGLDPARVVRVVDEVGNVGSASIPVSLDRLLRTRAVRPGDRILMAGVGAGISHGAVLYRVGG
jgi:3-oxoacyl-(acyl-carrier-protein) synthase III